MQGRPGPRGAGAAGRHADEGDQRAPSLHPRARPRPRPRRLRWLRWPSVLAAAKQPLVIVGGGGWTPEATSAMQAFAEAWQLPVGCAFRFQDLFDNAHPAVRRRRGHRYSIPGWRHA